jgi:hypothetical protein
MTHEGPRRKSAALIGGLALAAGIAMFFVPRIPQDPGYHDFADKRPCCGVPNFGDVASNLPFVLVGALGLAFTWPARGVAHDGPIRSKPERNAWIGIWFGTFLTGFGSAYYHWAPDSTTLFWDRLPMTIVFMSLFSAMLMERISIRAGSFLLVPLVLFGVSSILAWRWTEGRGAGDLRLYALVQFFPMLAIPLMLFLFPARYDRAGDYLYSFGCYAIAKILEFADRAVFETLGLVSGHTLKHLTAAVGMAFLLRMLVLRRPRAPQESEASPS